MTEDKKAWAILLLRDKSMELGRLPKKDDFDEATRSRIKAFLGPWPRALEAAGLKEARMIPPRPKKRRKAAPARQPHAKACADIHNRKDPEL